MERVKAVRKEVKAREARRARETRRGRERRKQLQLLRKRIPLSLIPSAMLPY